jgi:hypothetical protein
LAYNFPKISVSKNVGHAELLIKSRLSNDLFLFDAYTAFIENKMKNEKYHTNRTVPKFIRKNVGIISHCQSSPKI